LIGIPEEVLEVVVVVAFVPEMVKVLVVVEMADPLLLSWLVEETEEWEESDETDAALVTMFVVTLPGGGGSGDVWSVAVPSG
jgi:hypothetical protein